MYTCNTLAKMIEGDQTRYPMTRGHLLCGDTIFVVLMHLLINDFIAHGLDKNTRRMSVSTSLKTW